MSRYRAPEEKPSPYITPQGAKALRAELHQLWTVERPQVTAQVHEAAKNGDRSENGDYIYGKRRLREIDRRVRYLNKRLEEVTIVETSPTDTQRIFFGAWVSLAIEYDEITPSLEDQPRELSYRLVGADEIDPDRGFISIDSPLARALLGKMADSRVEVSTQAGQKGYRVLAIRYTDNIE